MLNKTNYLFYSKLYSFHYECILYYAVMYSLQIAIKTKTPTAIKLLEFFN
jgi:hypothetical protein